MWFVMIKYSIISNMLHIVSYVCTCMSYKQNDSCTNQMNEAQGFEISI